MNHTFNSLYFFRPDLQFPVTLMIDWGAATTPLLGYSFLRTLKEMYSSSLSSINKTSPAEYWVFVFISPQDQQRALYYLDINVTLKH